MSDTTLDFEDGELYYIENLDFDDEPLILYRIIETLRIAGGDIHVYKDIKSGEIHRFHKKSEFARDSKKIEDSPSLTRKILIRFVFSKVTR